MIGPLKNMTKKFSMIDSNLKKYSDRTAPYKKCLEFVTATEVKVTIGDAPAKIS